MALGSKQWLWDADEIVEVLEDAAKAVEQADPPEDLRADAFRYALQLRSQCQIVAGSVVTPGRML